MLKNRLLISSLLLVGSIANVACASDDSVTIWKPHEEPALPNALFTAPIREIVLGYVGTEPNTLVYCFSRFKHILKGRKNTGAPTFTDVSTFTGSDITKKIEIEFPENNRSAQVVSSIGRDKPSPKEQYAAESVLHYSLPLSELTSKGLKFDAPFRTFREYCPANGRSGMQIAKTSDIMRANSAEEAIKTMRTRFGSSFVPAHLDQTNGSVMYLETPKGNFLFTCQKQGKEYQLTAFHVHEDTIPGKKVFKRTQELLDGRPRQGERHKFFTQPKGLPQADKKK